MTDDPESEFAMKTNRKLTRFTAVLMTVLMILCAMAITGCAGEDNPKEKSKITETKKTPEQIAAEKKAKAEAEQKAREEAEKKAKSNRMRTRKNTTYLLKRAPSHCICWMIRTM